MGGSRWQAVLRNWVVPLLPSSICTEAVRRVDALADLPQGDTCLVHGDLAGSNVLWGNGRVVGVLDWDLAALDDPAEDAAALATWHGWSLIAQMVDSDTTGRARAFADTHPLQAIAFAVLNDRAPAEIQRAVARAARRLRPTG